MALPAIAAAAGRGAVGRLARRLGTKRVLGLAQEGGKTEEKQEKSSILSPRGFILISVGLLLDFLCLICVILILAFGVGLLLAKIVYFLGLVIFALFSIAGGKGQNALGDFFKRQWKKLLVKAIPGVGDAVPVWTITAISML